MKRKFMSETKFCNIQLFYNNKKMELVFYYLITQNKDFTLNYQIFFNLSKKKLTLKICNFKSKNFNYHPVLSMKIVLYLRCCNILKVNVLSKEKM